MNRGANIYYLKISMSWLNPHELFKINQDISVILDKQAFPA